MARPFTLYRQSKHFVHMLKKKIRDHRNRLEMAMHLPHKPLYSQFSRACFITENPGEFFLVLKIELIILAAADIMQTIPDLHQLIP